MLELAFSLKRGVLVESISKNNDIYDFFITIFLLCLLGRITAKGCYLWNESETIQMAEIQNKI